MKKEHLNEILEKKEKPISTRKNLTLATLLALSQVCNFNNDAKGNDFVGEGNETSIDAPKGDLHENSLKKDTHTMNNLSAMKTKGKSVEKITTPRLQKENYKIDKNMSLKEKLKNGRKKENVDAFINGNDTTITILKKTISGSKEDAFVREYFEGVPNNLKGEQLFNWNAVLNLGIDKKLPSCYQIFDMMGDDYNKFLEDNFQKHDENLFPGFFSPDNDSGALINLGHCAHYLLSDGTDIPFCEYNTSYYDNTLFHPSCGFSVRLLKD